MQEEKLYEKWEITDDNGKSKSDSSIEHAYVTFRSMKGKEMCLKVFKDA
jgi:hypothetical protein